MTKDRSQVPDLTPTSLFLTWAPENFLVTPLTTNLPLFIYSGVGGNLELHSLESLGDRHMHYILKCLAPQVVFHVHFLLSG